MSGPDVAQPGVRSWDSLVRKRDSAPSGLTETTETTEVTALHRGTKKQSDGYNGEESVTQKTGIVFPLLRFLYGDPVTSVISVRDRVAEFARRRLCTLLSCRFPSRVHDARWGTVAIGRDSRLPTVAIGHVIENVVRGQRRTGE